MLVEFLQTWRRDPNTSRFDVIVSVVIESLLVAGRVRCGINQD